MKSIILILLGSFAIWNLHYFSFWLDSVLGLEHIPATEGMIRVRRFWAGILGFGGLFMGITTILWLYWYRTQSVKSAEGQWYDNASLSKEDLYADGGNKISEEKKNKGEKGGRTYFSPYVTCAPDRFSVSTTLTPCHDGNAPEKRADLFFLPDWLSWRSQWKEVVMPRMGRIILPNYPHHVVQRGHNRQVVFAAAEDYQRYIADLRWLKDAFGGHGLRLLPDDESCSSIAGAR